MTKPKEVIRDRSLSPDRDPVTYPTHAGKT